MQIGYSLLLREFVTATEVDYGDCAEFQITCPVCSEAVFKAGMFGGDRQYLAHYAGTKSNVSDCELRVKSFSREQTERDNVLGRDQTLAQFFARFQDAVLDWVFGGDDYDAISMRRQFNWTVSRPQFHKFADYLRLSEAPVHVREPKNKMFFDHTIERYLATQSRFWIRRQRAFATDFMRHLEAPNSLAAWSFIIAVIVSLKVGGRARDILLYGKDSALRKWMMNIDRNLRAELTGLMITSIPILLILIPYTDMLGHTSRNTKKHRDILLQITKEGYWEEHEITYEEREERASGSSNLRDSLAAFRNIRDEK